VLVMTHGAVRQQPVAHSCGAAEGKLTGLKAS
jgi:hypothetical protein